jgi:hypothetical protein
VERIANVDSFEGFGEFLNELVVYAFMYEYARAGAACLSVVEPACIPTSSESFTSWHQSPERQQKNVRNAVRSPLDGIIEVRIVQNQRRTLPAQFKRHFLQIAIRRCLEDVSSNERA